jgi:hypothetical protein
MRGDIGYSLGTMKTSQTLVLLCILCAGHPLPVADSQQVPRTYGHGTVVVTDISPDSIVMATDGLQLTVDEYGRKTSKQNAIKITKCGMRSLCGGAGTYPIDGYSNDHRVVIHLNFEKLMATKQVKSATSVSKTAEAILAQLKGMLAGKEAALTDSNYWVGQENQLDRIFFQVATVGFNKGTPEYCATEVKFDLAQKKLIFPEKPRCGVGQQEIAKWGPTNCGVDQKEIVAASGPCGLIKESTIPGTDIYSKYFQTIYPNDRSTVGALFLKYNPALLDRIATLAYAVEVLAKVDPSHFGGETRVGVIVKGQPLFIGSLHKRIPFN